MKQQPVKKDQYSFVSGYPVMVRMRASQLPYLKGVSTLNTNDATADAILDEILRKYAGAWRRLSQM